MLRRDGSLGCVGVGACVSWSWVTWVRVQGQKSFTTFSMRGSHVFVRVLNGFECVGPMESETVGESGVLEFGSGVTL